MYMRKKITKVIVGSFLVTAVATLGCDPGPADAPPADGSSIEIDAVPQAHSSSDTVTKWKFQNRKRDGVITGKSADGKERFRARMAIMPDFQTSVLIVTKPSVLVLSIQFVNGERYEMAPTPPEASATPNAKTMAYLKQLQDDIVHHKHGFDEPGCAAASMAAGFAWATVALSTLQCLAGLARGDSSACDRATIQAGAVGAATGAIAAQCGWVQDIAQSVTEMGAALAECSGFHATYGIATDCSGVM
jgi:hypothetical protein